MRRLWTHLALAAVGLVAVVWALTVMAHPTIECRGQVMRPGDTCVNAQGTRVQTYEQRRAANDAARPVVGVAGTALAAFGAGLAWAEVRRAGSSGRRRPDRPGSA